MQKEIINILRNALKEDIKNKDITTDIFVNKKQKFKGLIFTKDTGIICGTIFAEKIFKILNPKAKIKIIKKDGSIIKKGERIMEILSDRTILSAERTALNLLQRLSAIATKTNYFVNLVKNKTKIYDTRKTTLNLRILEKYAVKCGKGENHRWGLFDAFMLKDNHLSLFKNLNDLNERIKIARKIYPNKKIEIEVQNLNQLKSILNFDFDIVMLDNMKYKDMQKAISLIKKINKKLEIEISGGINEKTLKIFSKLKPDRISIGSLTHSVKAMDISLDIKNI